MTPRERLFAALEGQPTDRVPVWLLFPYDRVGDCVDVAAHPHYAPVVEAAKTSAITLNRRVLPVPVHTPEVHRRTLELEEGGWRIARQYVEYRGVALYSEDRRRPGERATKRLLDSDEDLRRYAEFPVELDPHVIETALDGLMPRYRHEKDAFPAHLGAMMLDLGEPIAHLHRNANPEAYARWSGSRSTNDVVLDILDRLHRQLRIVYDYCLRHDLADVYVLAGSDLAAPPLVSRQTFQRWIVPYATESIARIHEAGKKAIQHHRGHIREVLPDFLTMAPDALHTIEAPPVGDCTLEEAFAVVRDRLTLIGNIRYDDLRSMKEPELRAAVTDLLDRCRGKRFILAPTTGPYETDVSPRVIGNYLALLRTAHAYPWS